MFSSDGTMICSPVIKYYFAGNIIFSIASVLCFTSMDIASFPIGGSPASMLKTGPQSWQLWLKIIFWEKYQVELLVRLSHSNIFIIFIHKYNIAGFKMLPICDKFQKLSIFHFLYQVLCGVSRLIRCCYRCQFDPDWDDACLQIISFVFLRFQANLMQQIFQISLTASEPLKSWPTYFCKRECLRFENTQGFAKWS